MEKTIVHRRFLDIGTSVLFIGVFGILISVLGFFVGSYLLVYLVPPWTSTEIDTEGRVFEEIVAYDIINYRDMDLIDVEIILRTRDEEYFSYYQENWQIMFPPFSEGKGLYFDPQPGTCSKLGERPLFIYLQKVKDSAYVFIADTATTTTIDWCYVLKEDGTLNQWTRKFSFDDLLHIVVDSMLVGFVVGGLTILLLR
jgi:hypothetical protein